MTAVQLIRVDSGVKALLLLGITSFTAVIGCVSPGSYANAAAPKQAPILASPIGEPPVGPTPIPVPSSVPRIEGNRVIVDETPVSRDDPSRSATATAIANSLDISRRPLVGTSPEDAGRFSIDYAVAYGKVAAGNAQVVLARRVSVDDLEPLGFGKINFEPSTPLMLVIMRGDFDRSGLIGTQGTATSKLKVKYLAYVFDLNIGIPVIELFSADGSYFKKVLNDPSLPDRAAG